MWRRETARVRATYRRFIPRGSAWTMAEGSTTTTWSYSSPLAVEASTTVRRVSKGVRSGCREPGRDESAVELWCLGVGRDDADGACVLQRCVHRRDCRGGRVVGRLAMLTSPPRRKDREGGTSASRWCRRRLASSATAPGTRNPVVSGVMMASGFPRWVRSRGQNRGEVRDARRCPKTGSAGSNGSSGGVEGLRGERGDVEDPQCRSCQPAGSSVTTTMLPGIDVAGNRRARY